MEADRFGVPSNVLGPLDPDLPALIGRIVMIAALLESRVAALRSGLERRPESEFAGLHLGTNITECRRLATTRESRLGDLAPPVRELLARLESANALRNELVHRVWAKAGLVEWAGWKPLPSRVRDGIAWTDWKQFSREQLIELLAELLALIDITTDTYNAVSNRLQFD